MGAVPLQLGHVRLADCAAVRGIAYRAAVVLCPGVDRAARRPAVTPPPVTPPAEPLACPYHPAPALLLLANVVLVFAWTAAFAAVAGQVAWQGRFLFPAIAALGTGLAIGLAAILPRRSALWTLVALLALVSVTAPAAMIAPRYPGFVMPAQPADWGNTRARLSLPWKRGVELRNAGFPARAATGETLDVTLTWHALEQLDADYLTFVHLVDAGGNVVAESNEAAKNGRFPTSSWVRGDWIEQTQQLSLAGVPAGRYELYAGLWDEAADRTLPVVDDDGTVANWRHAIGEVEITNR